MHHDESEVITFVTAQALRGRSGGLDSIEES
jgi:hypothetical protein